MLRRKISTEIESHLKSNINKMLIVNGARQIGKSYIIRHVGQRLFKNFIEINMEMDKQSQRLFANATSVDDFMLALSTISGEKMQSKENTLIFIDEIQAYDHLLTLAKFLVEDGRFSYIASGSLLGVTLKKTQSIPIGSISILPMYPLDFEEFLWANQVSSEAILAMQVAFNKRSPLSESMHEKIMGLFRRYLLVGGMPDAINTYIAEHNIVKVRKIHKDIHALYSDDAAKYEQESSRKRKIKRIYEMLPSNLENKKKRIKIKDIENKIGKRASDYQDEFDYLISSGIALEVNAISQPKYPLVQNAGKNLLKLYFNDIGIFSSILYNNNIKPILEDIPSINLGALYENIVAQELKAHGFNLYYYDNKKNGEVDFLIDDTSKMNTLPIEVKSGKDYKIHSALKKFLSIAEYNTSEALVLSNQREVTSAGGITYLPIYYVMFLQHDITPDDTQF